MNTAKTDTLGTIEKNAVTEVGAPSYTSGAHIWNGTAVSLNKKPTKIKIIPSSQPRKDDVPATNSSAPQVKIFANSEKLVTPVKP